jgi:DNA-nicking Smr family endonuclease
LPRREDKNAFHRPFGALAKLKEKAVQSSPAKPTLASRKTATSPTAPAAPRRAQSDEDLFLQEMAGTQRIDDRSRVGVEPTREGPSRRSRAGGAGGQPAPVGDDAEVLASLADLCGGDGPFDIADSDEYIEGVAEGIDRRLLRRLRAGDYAVQAHVDLHGLTRDEAKEKVGRFIVDSRRAGRRCVLIVHGRGLHSKDQIPVLKQALRGWLERGHLARSVLAFATARPADGGAGAVYALLRR